MKKEILLRSFMFVPAYNKKFIDKALTSNADAIILDMEDSVPRDKRPEARNIIKEYSESGLLKQKKIFVRLNHIGTQDFVNDISELVLNDIVGFMPSKINSAEDVVFIDKLLTFMEMKKGLAVGELILAPLIETTQALANVHSIAAASTRLVALCFGGEDYLNDLGSVYTYHAPALMIPRALIANAARSQGLLPIDTPYINISDTEGFENAERQAYENGYAGCLVLNPKQIDAANRAFTPDDEKVTYSRRVIEAVKESERINNSSVVMLDGGMVGPPMRKRAEAVIKQIEMIERHLSR